MFNFKQTCHGLLGITKSLISTRTITSKSGKIKHLNVDVPDHIDWRKRGVVGPVVNQGTNLRCWAYAAVACVEALNCQATGKFIKLSEQHLVDDATETVCGRGNVAKGFKFIIKNRGLAADSDYPLRKTQFAYGAIDDYAFIPWNDELALKRAVARQPVAISVDASSTDFYNYKGGIYRKCFNIEKINHSMVIVGYGSTKYGEDYWICRNSWGSIWGEGGYMRILRNIVVEEDCFNVAYYAVYPMRKDFPPPFKCPYQPMITYQPCLCISCRPDLHDPISCLCILCRPDLHEPRRNRP